MRRPPLSNDTSWTASGELRVPTRPRSTYPSGAEASYEKRPPRASGTRGEAPEWLDVPQPAATTASTRTATRRGRSTPTLASNGRVEEPRLVREDDRLDAVTEVELLEDVRDVRLDGRVADVELSADLGVREAAGDEAKHVELALREIGELSRGLGLGNAREPLDHAFRDGGGEERISAGDDTDRGEELLGRSSLSTNPLAPARSAS